MPGSSRMRSIGSYPPASCTASPPPSYAIAVKRTLEAQGSCCRPRLPCGGRAMGHQPSIRRPRASLSVRLQSLRSASAT
jgi:hypothetical protein